MCLLTLSKGRWENMRLKLTSLIVLLIFTVSVIAGCTEEKGPREIYEDYLAVAMTSCADAATKYCHYERAQYRQMAADTTDYFKSYEIYTWEQLSDSLWVAELRFTCLYAGEEVIHATNFVGVIDGAYYVMTSIEEVPAYLLADVDVCEYTSATEMIVTDVFSFSN